GGCSCHGEPRSLSHEDSLRIKTRRLDCKNRVNKLAIGRTPDPLTCSGSRWSPWSPGQVALGLTSHRCCSSGRAQLTRPARRRAAKGRRSLRQSVLTSCVPFGFPFGFPPFGFPPVGREYRARGT